MSDEWEDLCQSLSSEAEGFAATDPANGYLYEGDARSFARRPAPADVDAWRERRERAEELRRLWRHRINRNP